MFPWKSKNLYSILLTSLSAVMGVSLISPVLPNIRKALQLTDLQTGTIITLYTLPAVLLAPIAGSLIDFYGRRTVLIPSLFLFGGAGFAVSFVHSYPILILLRITQGIGGTSLALISRTLVGDLFEGSQQQSVMGLNDSTLAIGAALFPFLGGYLGLYDWSFPFMLYLFPILVGAFTAIILETVPLQKDHEPTAYIKQGFNLIKDPYTTLYLLITFLSFVLLYGGIQTASPLFLSDRFGYGAGTIGFLMTFMAISMAIVSLLNGILVESIGNRSLVLTGFSLYAFGLVCLGMSSTFLPIVVGFVIFGCGHGLLLPSLNTLIVRLVDNERRGAIMAYRTVSARLGQSFGPMFFPMIGFIAPYDTVFVGTGLLLFAGLLPGIYISGTNRPR
jgi:MFS family permease